MSYTFYYDPFTEFESLFDDAFERRNHRVTQSGRQDQVAQRAESKIARPRMDLHENPEKNVVEATFELPGINKNDVNIGVHNNRLTVSGEVKQTTERDESGYVIRERRIGKFSRTLQLPAGTQTDQIKASMENGILTVSFPKTSPSQAPQRITVA